MTGRDLIRAIQQNNLEDCPIVIVDVYEPFKRQITYDMEVYSIGKETMIKKSDPIQVRTIPFSIKRII